MAKWIGGYCRVCGLSTMGRFSDRDPKYCALCKPLIKPRRQLTPRQRAREMEQELKLFRPAWQVAEAAEALDRTVQLRRPQLPPPSVPVGTFDYIGPAHTPWFRRQYPQAKIEHYAHRGP